VALGNKVLLFGEYLFEGIMVRGDSQFGMFFKKGLHQ
jgi:hypothetical protein